jgi:hypothetical protein
MVELDPGLFCGMNMFFFELTRIHLRQCFHGLLQGIWSRDQFPSVLALQEAFGQVFLADSRKQPAIQISEPTFSVIVGAGQTRHIINEESQTFVRKIRVHHPSSLPPNQHFIL